MENNNKWSGLSVREKIQYSLAALFGIASVVIGFVAFIILLEIPNSVIGISALWASVSCGILGISLHFRNQMVDFQTKVRDKLDGLDDEINRKIKEDFRKEEE